MHLLKIFVISITALFSTLSVYLYKSSKSAYNFKPYCWNCLSFLAAKAAITLSLYLKIAFSVFKAFLYYNSYEVGSAFYYGYYFPPFFACFLSSFLVGAFPPFLFLSSTTSYSLLNILVASDISFYSLGNPLSLIISRSLSIPSSVEFY